VFQGVVHREVKTGFGSYVLKTDTLMQSTRLIFEKKSKFDTAFEGKAVENLGLHRNAVIPTSCRDSRRSLK